MLLNDSFMGERIIYVQPRIVEEEVVNGSLIVIRKVISI